MKTKTWNIKPSEPFLTGRLAGQLGIAPLTAQLLLNRGMKTPPQVREFLEGNLSQLHSPQLFEDMDKAIQRIRQALQRREKILIYGDYDVDGIAGISLLLLAFRQLGQEVSYYLPHRIREGYSLNKKSIREAKANQVNLIITVDCGIDSYEEISLAKKEGIDVIITDHHKVKDHIPPALAIINPWFSKNYPFKNLAGVGVVYKLVQALAESFPEISPANYLDLATLGTVADVVPLIEENRILVREGLKEIANCSKLGINALLEVAGIKRPEITADKIAFILGPRLNAGGRMDSARKGVNLLTTPDEEIARKIAQELNQDNRLRQKMEEQILKKALQDIETKVDLAKERVLVLSDDQWHPGIIGIVASRISERFFKPTIIISLDGDKGKGSGRSRGDFDLFASLNHCADCLDAYGGHKHAAGLEIIKANLDSFRKKINAYASKLPEESFLPTLEADGQIALKELTFSVVKEFSLLEPFGEGNEEPLFITPELKIAAPPKRVGNNHLKFWVEHNNFFLEAIGFGKGDYLDHLKKDVVIDLAYSPQLDQWEGRKSVVLRIEDIKIK